MPEITSKTTHYIVHSTPPNPIPGESTFGTSAPYHGDDALGRALRAAQMDTEQGVYSFVTARDDSSSILAVIPVIPYMRASETHLPHTLQAEISRLCSNIREG